MLKRTLTAVLATASLGAAAPAFATDDSTVQTISAAPLTVDIGGRGQLQAFRSGSTSGIFYRASEQLGDAGFFLAFPPGTPPSLTGKVFGFDGSAGPSVPPLTSYTQISQTAPTGDGGVATPFKQVTTYGVASSLIVTQT